jgi:hypothetical protein
MHDWLGVPLYARCSTEHSEALWAVTATGQTSQTICSLTEALDVALTWAVASGGEIYRLDHPGAEPGL